MPRIVDNSFQSVWARIEAHTEKPFLMSNGRDMHYRIENDAVCFSCHRQPVTQAVIEEALQLMPCPSFEDLPKHLKPRNAIWTLLSDTRIYQYQEFTAYKSKKYSS